MPEIKGKQRIVKSTIRIQKTCEMEEEEHMGHPPKRKGDEKPAKRLSEEDSRRANTGKGTKKARGAVHASAPSDGGGFGPDIAGYRICCRLLTTAVPLWVGKIDEQGGLTRQLLIDAYIDLEVVGNNLDRLLHGPARSGEAASMFNKIARALAVLSYMPSGVESFEAHYSAEAILARRLGQSVAQERVQAAREQCFTSPAPSWDELKGLAEAAVKSAVSSPASLPAESESS
jgi:hypothetical protein